MNILGIIESPFEKAKSGIEALYAHLVPPALRVKIGTFAHTFTANLVHDAGDLAGTLTQEAVHSVWTCIETTATNIAPEIMSGKIGFGAAMSTAVKALKSDVAVNLVPAMKLTSETTVQSWLGPLLSTAMAAAETDPTSAVASQPAASPQALSSASSKQ